MRYFEVCKGWEDKEINLPKRSTANSAGYDFELADDITLPCDTTKITLVPTGIKANMKSDEFLQLCNRSSNAKKGIVMGNSIGIIDADYYSNLDNDGHIMFAFINISNHPISLKKGERIGQGIFQKFLITDNDDAVGNREGGFGSTG